MSAVISECGRYRYQLQRKLPGTGRPCLFIMLNPSIADAELNDQTIRICMLRGTVFNWSSLTVVNLFAIRTTKPKNMLLADDPVGPLNNAIIKSAVRDHSDSTIIAAWGKWDKHPLMRERADWLRGVAPRVYCLGVNKDGSPKHPLFIPVKKPLIPWEWFPPPKQSTEEVQK